MKDKIITAALAAIMVLAIQPIWSWAQDWYVASGKPVQRAALNSADIRTEFAAIDTEIADKLPALTGNGGKLIAVNSGGTALEAINTDLTDFADLTASNNFTGTYNSFSGTQSRLRFNETDAAANNQLWDLLVSGEQWRMRVVNDADNSGTAFMTVDRTANTVDEIQLDATTFDLNGTLDLSGAASFGAGGATFSATGQLLVTNTGPRLRLLETDAAADNGGWDMFAGGEALNIRVINDADSSGVNVVHINRTGNTIDEIELNGTLLDFNGAMDLSGNGKFNAAQAIEIESTLPDFLFDETDAGANERQWRARSSGGVWRLDAYTDADVLGNNAIAIDRSGTTISEIELNATAFDLNGNLDVSGTVQFGAASADLPMGGFKHTGVGNATARTQYATVDQLQDGELTYLGSVAGTNTITASLTPAISAYAAGQVFTFTPAAANTGAVTININSVGAIDVLKFDGDPLVAGDLVTTVPAQIIIDAGGDDAILLNPNSIQGLRAVKTAQETVTSSTTLQDDDHLVVAVEADQLYAVMAYVSAGQSSYTSDIKMAFSVPASATFAGTMIGVENDTNASNTVIGTRIGTTENDYPLSIGGGGNSRGITITGILDTAGTAGNFQFQWAQQTSSGTAVAVGAGSWMILNKL